MASTELAHDVVVPQWAWKDAPSFPLPWEDAAPLPLPRLLGSNSQEHTAEAAVAKISCRNSHVKCDLDIAKCKEPNRVTNSKKPKRLAGTRLQSDSLLRNELSKERQRCADLAKQRDHLQERCATVSTEVEYLRERIHTLETEAQANGQLSARGVAAARAHLVQARHKNMGETTIKEMCSLRERINQQVHRELLLERYALSLAGELERCAAVSTAQETPDTSTSSASSSDSGEQSISSMSQTQAPSQLSTTLLEILSDERVMREALQLRAAGLQATMQNVATELRNLIVRPHAEDKWATMNQPGSVIRALPDAPQAV